MTELRIKNLLVKHGRGKMQKRSKLIEFTRVEEYDHFLNDLQNFSHAFVIGCVMDRQMNAELAWAIPYKLKERIGNFDFSTLYQLNEKQISKYLKKPTPLHRFTDIMSGCLYSAIQIIGDKYDGVASKIWSDKPSSAEVVYRFMQIHGVGPKIATMAANILARSFKVKFKDYYSIDISADVHVKRVFNRLGLIEKNASIEEVIYKARALNPEFPGLLDSPCWEVGRNWCKTQVTECNKCYLNHVCPSANKQL